MNLSAVKSLLSFIVPSFCSTEAQLLAETQFVLSVQSRSEVSGTSVHLSMF